jgi:uncharacterized protein YutE (UPF0331/DUF86 family)
MGKLDIQSIQEHIINLSQNLEKLKRIKKTYSKVLFLENNDIIDVCLHAFQLAIQNILDIGAHILAAHFQYNYNKYEEIISPQFKTTFYKMASFRNKLVHGYIDINFKEVYNYLNRLPAIEQYIKEIKQFLDKQER